MEAPDLISTEEFIKFFEERSAIKLKSFADECGLNESNLRAILTGRFNLTGKVFLKAWPVMLKYGYGYSKEQVNKTKKQLPSK